MMARCTGKDSGDRGRRTKMMRRRRISKSSSRCSGRSRMIRRYISESSRSKRVMMMHLTKSDLIRMTDVSSLLDISFPFSIHLILSVSDRHLPLASIRLFMTVRVEWSNLFVLEYKYQMPHLTYYSYAEEGYK